MYFSDRITLRTVTPGGTDADGYPTAPVTVDVEVWANRKSATRSEFYAANAKGIEILAVFDVHAEDYGGQKTVVYGGKVYNVVRSYQVGEGTVELNCSEA